MDENELLQANAALPAAPDLKKAKKTFSRLGMALFVFFVIVAALQGLASFLLGRFDETGSPLLQWGVGYILPLYGIGVPVALLILRRAPAESWEAHPFGIGNFFRFLLMCFPVMYGGNLIGNILSYMFSSGTAENPLNSLVTESSWIQVIVLVVLAPLFEEFIFRKQLIDRCRRYGEQTAILFSGLTFGLFHANLYQFFYAFGLGLLFAYVYIRTRRLRWTVMLHMIINFLGSVLAPWILTQTDTSALEAIISGSLDVDPAALSSVGLLSLYGLFLIGLSIAGLVILIKFRRKFLLLPTAEELPRGTRFKTVCLNAGVILFTLVCVGSMAALLII